MGKTSHRLDIDPEELRLVMTNNNYTPSRAAKAYGVTRQAVNGWFKSGKIPPRALAEIAKEMELSPDIIDSILKKKQKYKIKIQIELEPI